MPIMADFLNAREEIDNIDKNMALLFEQRMKKVHDIAVYKCENDIAIFDSEREKSMLERNILLIENPSLRRYYSDFLKAEIAVSKKYQEEYQEKYKEKKADCAHCAQFAQGKSIFVKSKNGGYRVTIKRGAIDCINDFITCGKKALIVTDDGVPHAYANAILSRLKSGGLEPFLFTLKRGESSKSPENLFSILSYLIEKNFSRHDLVIALGGGVVGDLSGLAASLFMRGIDFLNIPTTTISMIDSAIGGKTAIDFCGVKNPIGTFYPPIAVIIDPDLLKTLPHRHYNNGLIEALKAGMIYDSDLFSLFYTAATEKCDFDDFDIETIIYRSLMVKKAIIEQDENEKDIRKILNFGHTIGHALEALSQDTKSPLLHGEAVAWGMTYMMDDANDIAKVKSVFSYLSMPPMPNLSDFSKDEIAKLITIISHDKKSSGEYIETVRIKNIGEAYLEKVKPNQIIML